jgi:hypothetical protein
VFPLPNPPGKVKFTVAEAFPGITEAMEAVPTGAIGVAGPLGEELVLVPAVFVAVTKNV